VLAFAFADPWPGPVYARRLEAEGAADAVLIERPAIMGARADPLPAAAPHRWARGGLTVRLFGGSLATGGAAAALRGVRRAALQSPLGGWEVIDVAEAPLARASCIALHASMIALSSGDRSLAEAAVTIVALLVFRAVSIWLTPVPPNLWEFLDPSGPIMSPRGNAPR